MSVYIRKYYNKAYLLIAVICVAASGVIPALLLPVRSGMIDFALASDGSFVLYAGILALLMLLLGVSSIVQERIDKKQQIVSSHALDKERLSHCMKLAFPDTETEEFFQLNATAAEASGIMKEAYQALISIVRCVIQLISCLLVICFISSYVAMGVAGILAVGFLLNSLEVKHVGNMWADYRQNIRRSEYFSSVLLKREYATERKVFGYGKEIGQRFDAEYLNALKANSGLGRKRLLLETISHAANAGFVVVALALLALPLWRGNITIGVFLSAFFTTTSLLSCISQLVSSSYTYQSSQKKLIPYATLMNKPEEISTDTDAAEGFQSIMFRHVSFCYPSAKEPVLRDVSFRLEKGKHYALVGENGSGKTTLLKCLTGLYPPNQGEILLNDKPICCYSKDTLRRMLTAVFQDYYRYPLTLRENISMCADKQLSDDEIFPFLQALNMEGLTERLTDGLDSELLLMKENSSELSGGEWQKLSVLRCVLSDCGFAVLDEPNSALDPVVEAAIYAAYRQMLNEKTTLFISHRLGSVKIADEILVIKDGCILARGTHDSLMKTCAYYAMLFETQKGFYEV